MKYKVIFGKTPVETVKSEWTETVATDALEAVKCALREVGRDGQSYEVLSENGDNTYHLGVTSHFLVRVCDNRGVVCVVPTTSQKIGVADFPVLPTDHDVLGITNRKGDADTTTSTFMED